MAAGQKEKGCFGIEGGRFKSLGSPGFMLQRDELQLDLTPFALIFSYFLFQGLPDEPGRRQIFVIHTKQMIENKMVADDVDLDELACEYALEYG